MMRHTVTEAGSMKIIAESSTHQPVVLDFRGYDRIRNSSPERINQKVARRARENIERYSNENRAVITKRVEDLDREWDIDRAVMVVFSLLGGLTLGLGLRKNRNWFGFLALQLGLLSLHAMQGWCPPVSILRRLGFRSRFEIDAEKYALKTLRGDFTRDNRYGIGD